VALARNRLTPGGAVVTNIIGAVEGDQSRLFRAMYRTYRSEFARLYVHPVDDEPGPGDDADLRNITLVATDEPAVGTRLLLDRASVLHRSNPGSPDLTQQIETRYQKEVPVDDVPTLVDDFAPTDELIQVVSSTG
jgi:hypothetical protein